MNKGSVLTRVRTSCYSVRMGNIQKTKKINIREARPLLNKLSEEVALTDGYYIITVRDKPKSILTNYNEEFVNMLDKRMSKKSITAGAVFADGMGKWFKNNPPVISKTDVTSQIDKIAYV